MISAELLLHLNGGSILTQAIIVKALHEAKVIDKSKIIELANHWAAEISEFEEVEAANIKTVIDLFVTLIEGEEAPGRSSFPSWFRGIVTGGKAEKTS